MKNLAKNILAVRKGGNERNVNLFADAVDKTIADQIKLKKEEVVSLKEDLKTSKEDSLLDFQDGLMQIDNESIKCTGDRKEYAENYVQSAIQDYQQILDEEKDIQDTIDKLEKQIKALTAIDELMSKMVIEVEKAD